jgi:hypothetical protein
MNNQKGRPNSKAYRPSLSDQLSELYKRDKPKNYWQWRNKMFWWTVPIVILGAILHAMFGWF